MNLSLIVATAENGAIGKDGDLPWRLSADLKRFKRLTMGHHIILGRKTFDSIGRPLPGRTMVVLTRDRKFQSDHALSVHSIDDALSMVRADDEPFVIGGSEVYRAFLPLVTRIYFTTVRTVIESADAFFPELAMREWHCVESEETPKDDKNEFPTWFQVLNRRTS